MKMWIIGAAVGVALSAAGTSSAFAQAGSTGGTVGKSDKSTSGEGQQSEPEPRRKVRVRPGGESIASGIRVISATLGQNCGAPRGNVTDKVAELCNGKQSCSLPGSQVSNPDPAFACNKSFAAEWQCGGVSHANSVPPVAWETNVLTLSCR
jgi:hypothetical protein